MPEQEELKLVVTLDDQASSKLAALQGQLEKIDRGTGGSGSTFAKMSEHSTKAAAGVKSLHSELERMATRAGFVGGLVGTATIKLAEFGTELIKEATNINKIALEMNSLSVSASRMGTSAAQLESNLQGFRRVGVTFESATAQLSNFNDAMADFGLINSRLRPQLLSSGFTQSSQQMLQFFERIDRAKGPEAQLEVIRQMSHAVRDFATARGGAQFGAREERRFLGMFGVEDVDRLTTGLRTVSAHEKQLFEGRDKANRTFIEQQGRIQDGYDGIVNSMGSILINLDNATGRSKIWADAMDGVKHAVEAIEEGKFFKWLTGGGTSQWPDWSATNGGIADPMAGPSGGFANPHRRPSTTSPAIPYPDDPSATGQGGWPSWMQGWSLPQGNRMRQPGNRFMSGNPAWDAMRRSDNIEDRRDLEDNTEETKNLTEQMKALNDMLLTPPPGSLAAQLGINQIKGSGGGGAGTGPQGVYSPNGGVAPPGSSVSSGESGGSTSGTGGSTGGGGGTRGDRNNNPGNLKMGPHARAFGAVGADDKGFAIFPNRESGEAAQETLLKSDRYKGLTLSQFAGKYAEGSPDWAKTVGGTLGIGPNDIVNNQDPRLAGAIRKAEGTGGARGDGSSSGSGAPPSAILEQAQQVAVLGGPAAVSKFMADQGYPKNGAWCGQFAASVVKAAGGTPPKNPAIATNWRNYGNEVGTPQPGDIAVRKGSRFGGYAPTGSTGSHVNIVESYDPKSGSFSSIGGNQGPIRGQASASRYQFFRASPLDGTRLDGNRDMTVTGKGQLEVTVNGPPGTRASGSGEGLLKDTTITRETQMVPANKGADMPAAQGFD